MMQIKPAYRISLGLTLFTLSLLLTAEVIGFFPDPYKQVLEMRKRVCESLAIFCSLSLQKGDLEGIRTTMQVLSHRNPDILSTGLRDLEGTLLMETGEHKSHWKDKGSEISTGTNILVPIFKNETRWGTFEVGFKPVYPGGIAGLLAYPIVRVVVFIVPLAFLGYFLLMKRTLRYLDPASVIPERVKSALDAFVEGVVVLDKNERIILANKSFSEKIGKPAASLIGCKASELEWISPKSQETPQALPWQQVILNKQSQSGVPLSFASAPDGICKFMVSGSPIKDDAGAIRGALATFDDVTELEKRNDQLQEMFKALQKSRDEVRRQNRELQVMATQDALTKCLNRRSFFEKFEMEFNRARRYGIALSCIMIDIDKFKVINDTHGHQAGDQVLQRIADWIRSELRGSDFLCRYGGEEFCVLLPHANADDSARAAERIRNAVSSREISGIKVTVSLGISSTEFGAGDPQELLGQADNALYAAKNSGRNVAIRWDICKDWFSHKHAEATEEPTKEQNQDGAYIPYHVVSALMLALAHRDVETAEHSRQVAEFCVAAAQKLMSLSDCFVLEVAGLLHDIGKLGVPDSILLKPGALTEEEMQVMAEQKLKSVEVIASTFLSPILVEIVQYSQGWYEGTQENPGHPKGKDLPLGSRILSIADAFSSMVSHHSYRRARTFEEAFEELRRFAGKQFDPDLVEHFIEVIRARDESRQQSTPRVFNAVKLEIGQEVEKLFVAVNTSAFGALGTIADRLFVKANKHGLGQVVAVARKIQKATEGKPDIIQILRLASELTEVCCSREIFGLPDTSSLEKARAA
jgi:diguanylate cyclase (GGDEF)-like protein/PAS domain S-box-containing protein